MLTFAVAATLLAAPAQSPRVANDLKQIALAYHGHMDAVNKPPAKAEDLAPYFENDKRILEALKTNGIVFHYNVPILQIVNTTGTSLTVLAYEKDAPEKGGYVAYFDGTVKKLTAEDFKKAIQPKKP